MQDVSVDSLLFEGLSERKVDLVDKEGVGFYETPPFSGIQPNDFFLQVGAVLLNVPTLTLMTKSFRVLSCCIQC